VTALLRGEPLDLADVAFPWGADGVTEGAGPPVPLGLPGLPVWVEVLVPGEFPLVSPIVCWNFASAKTPTTTRTTAPATARAGRNQAIAGPIASRSGAPALRGRFAGARPARDPRTRSDRSCPLSPSAVASGAVPSPAPAPAARRDRTALNQD
jgi:hypothetical protein